MPIELYKALNEKPNLLMVIHDFRYEKGGSVGGTTLHLLDIIEGLKDTYNFHVLYWSANTHQHQITSFFENGEATRILGKFEINRKEVTKTLFNAKFGKKLNEVVNALGIDVIHIHHLKNMFLDIFKVAESNSIPVIYSVHDFYAACPSINMMSFNGQSCHTPQTRNCERCTKLKFGLPYQDILLWQKEFGEALSSAKAVIAPAGATREILLSVYPTLKIDVIEHGYETAAVTKQRCNDDEMLNIAFVGSITKIKGLEIFIKLVSLVKGSKIRLHLFGTTHKIAIKSDNVNFINHGLYKREELPELLAKSSIDIVCLPSICAETFSYTLSESFISNIPVIGLEIGAIAERIKKIDAGWVLPLNTSAEELFLFIEELRTNRHDEYLSKVENLKANRHKMLSVAEMCDRYSNIYSSLISDNPKRESDPIIKKEFFSNRSLFALGVEVDNSGRERYRTLRDRISSENLPFAEIFKEIKLFRKDFPKSKLRNRIAFKLLWHKISHKKM